MSTGAERLRFDDFELRPESGELFRGARPVRLQQQPARVLGLLARRSGQVVSREEIAREIWGEDHFVDAEQGLNYCVRQIRIALGDEAGDPRFVETVPRRGYRFVASVEPVPLAPTVAGTAVPVEPAASGTRRALLALAVLLAALWVIVGMRSAAHRADDGPRAAPAGIAAPVLAERPGAPPGVPAEAYEAYLEGVYLAEKQRVEDRLRAVEPLSWAIEQAPGFAAAHAAWAKLQIGLLRPPAEALPEAERAADRALELDPSLATAHLVKGEVAKYLHRDWAAAESSYRRALELEPSSIETLLAYGHLLSALGRHDQAIAIVQRARGLDPASALISSDLAFYYYFARRFTLAEKTARATLELEPGNVWAHAGLVFTALERGDREGAVTAARDQLAAEVAAERARPPAKDPRTLEDYWRARLAIYDGWRGRGYYVSPAADATLHLALGDVERALELLEQACDERSLSLMLAVDPRFDELRGDGRFAEILACAGHAA